jgi:hypothetical protein
MMCCLMCCLVAILEAAPASVHGLKEDELHRLPTKQYSEGDYDADDAKCAICLSRYDQGEIVTSCVSASLSHRLCKGSHCV